MPVGHPEGTVKGTLPVGMGTSEEMSVAEDRIEERSSVADAESRLDASVVETTEEEAFPVDEARIEDEESMEDATAEDTVSAELDTIELERTSFC